MTFLLLSTFIYLAFAVVSVLVSQKLGLGSVLGYLMAGIVIGPMLGFVGKETESIQHVAEFGVVMMLFLVGLELAPQMLWQLRHKLLGLGGLQVGLSLAAIAGIAIALGYSWQIGVAVGCILALSSTAIVLQTFNEKQLLPTQGGQAGFAVLLFQDVAAIPMLALMPLLAASGIRSTGDASHGTNLLAHQPAWIVALVSIASIAIIIVAVRYLVPFAFKFISKHRVHEMFTVFTLTLVVGIATLMSSIGLSPALGAFIAGVALANSSYRHEMESYLEPFKGLFLGLFFITVGAGMNFGLLQHKFFPIIGMTLGLLLVKALILWILGKVFRLPPLAAKLFALSLAQAGEFGFVLLSIAKQHAVLPAAVHDRIGLVIALSMVLTPLLFIFYDKVLAPRAIETENEARQSDDIHEENPVILLGHGRFGQHVNSILTACGFRTTVIDNHAEMVEGLAKFGIKTYYGDATRPELLGSVGLAKAKLLIVTVGDRHKSTEIVEYVRRHYPNLRIIARAYDRAHAYELHHAGADYIIREIVDSAIRGGRIALEKLGLAPEQARELVKFYAARDRYLSDQVAEVFNPNVPIFAQDETIEVVRSIDGETKNMIQALLRGEKVDWEEKHENERTQMKQGIS
ncbi:monovalent cation:proton antiporter-2 (CPA2) family protein [Kingella kingae]|uniref:CPA2 family potassium:proton (K+:H+) antiporter n=2 Tax=Kingella kingae TaxID=504 RepID=F5S6M3_KINKI|nr:monovalent cation:proton antiporter-2 (CPA2) family protein [Kingella kingae]EGK09660.1 CPA2 family potassium:proton (K+:H+) antiporter [Kingella kingae ATCC 23330]MDK4544579.1 monovalent cation:proton antiporter-2 (CPA2) family protein [Kingella kingae]MDK4566379.1 monovalent cation:proton antiporter-2 (CPA2) family protein [Kingella kingae]MDK4574495.1 monovalent cation:proton antiporter-2 (CPA2) family protein [Kingella kingae]MDK4606703.1 monovalent cation:proton antiporter-2 (CPA2) fam